MSRIVSSDCTVPCCAALYGTDCVALAPSTVGSMLTHSKHMALSASYVMGRRTSIFYLCRASLAFEVDNLKSKLTLWLHIRLPFFSLKSGNI